MAEEVLRAWRRATGYAGGSARTSSGGGAKNVAAGRRLPRRCSGISRCSMTPQRRSGGKRTRLFRLSVGGAMSGREGSGCAMLERPQCADSIFIALRRG